MYSDLITLADRKRKYLYTDAKLRLAKTSEKATKKQLYKV